MTVDALLATVAERGVELWVEGSSLRFKAPQDALTPELRDALRGEKTAIVAALRARLAATTTRAPLAIGQQSLWFVTQQAPENSAYNVPVAVWLHSSVDVGAMRRALQALVDRHASLRTTFAAEDGVPVQVVRGTATPDFRLVDAPGWIEERLRATVLEESRRPFDLVEGPLFRTRLYTRAPHQHVLLVAAHHIVLDGWSLLVLMNELKDLYACEAGASVVTLPRPEAQYVDFARDQIDRIATPAGEAAWQYWRKGLEGAPTVLELPTDRPRPAVQQFNGGIASFVVGPGVAEGLRAVARSCDTTMFVVLLAAYNVLLHRYTGQEDIIVGTPTFGRNRPEFAKTIGHFVNTVPLRTRLGPAEPFTSLVRRVRGTVLEALAQDDYPLPLLVERMQLTRDLSRTPLVQTTFTLETFDQLRGADRRVRFGALELSPFPLLQTSGQFELSLSIGEKDGDLLGVLGYDVDLFEASTADRMARHMAVLLEDISGAPETPVQALRLLPEEERRLLLGEFAGGTATFPARETIHVRFSRQAAATPDAVAVTCEGASLTYRELDDRANRLAHRLVALGVGPEERVAMYVERSLAMVVGIVAVLKAGGAYVPMDPVYPPDRVAFMLEDAGAPVLLTERALAARLPATDAKILLLDDLDALVADGPATAPIRAVEPEHAAYVIYTSGSTGKPKGVVVTHANVARLLDATEHWYGFGASDVWTLFHSFAFDFSVWELWGALLYGGRLVVVSQAVTRDPRTFYTLLRDEGVTVLNQTPSAFRQLIAAEPPDADPAALSLRYVIFGGEALEPASLRTWVDRHGDQRPRLINMYGITETTVHVTYRPISSGEVRGGAPSVIGVPIPDLRLYVLDSQGEIAPTGVAGEIYVGGAGVARGYHNRPELTHQRFVPDRFSASGGRLYRSGDLARRLPNGDLEYLGRTDDQVKIRGFRIELGEIEAAIGACDGVREVVVLPVELSKGDVRLTAHIVCEPGIKADEAAIRATVRARLPEYMVPAAWLWHDSLPLTSNGKVDRRALRARGTESLKTRAATSAPAAPLSDTEVKLVEIWRDVLKLTEVGRDDDFFGLGGHSLLATQMMARLRGSLGVELPLRVLFERPTVAGLAEQVTKYRPTDKPPQWKCLVPVQPGGTRIPLFIVAGYNFEDETTLILSRLIPHFGPEQPIFGLRPRWLDGSSRPYESVEEMTRECLDEIRAIQPQGPYLIGGLCIASSVALEIARLLTQQGESVQMLAMIDGGRPCRLRSLLMRLESYAPLNFGMRMTQRVGKFLRADARMRNRMAWKLVRRKFDVSEPGEGAAAAPNRFQSLIDRHILVMVDHRPDVYDGDITMIASEEYDSFNRYMGWSPIVKGSVAFHKLPGDHQALLTEHMKALVQLLRNDMENVLPRSAQPRHVGTAQRAHEPAVFLRRERAFRSVSVEGD